MENTTRLNPNEPIDVIEAARFLRISRDSLYQLMSKRKIRYYKVNRKKAYFRFKDLEDYVFNEKNLVESKVVVNQKV